ncbi:hypothetical protein ABTE05_20435, partial [Acinetobacter baumannii]
MESTRQLASGRHAPAIAFGTGTRWYKQKTRELVDSVKAALNAGFRHLDLAELYGSCCFIYFFFFLVGFVSLCFDVFLFFFFLA